MGDFQTYTVQISVYCKHITYTQNHRYFESMKVFLKIFNSLLIYCASVLSISNLHLLANKINPLTTLNCVLGYGLYICCNIDLVVY